MGGILRSGKSCWFELYLEDCGGAILASPQECGGNKYVDSAMVLAILGLAVTRAMSGGGVSNQLEILSNGRGKKLQLEASREMGRRRGK